MDNDRSAGHNTGRIMQLNRIIHLIKHLSVLLVQIGSKLCPLCSLYFRTSLKDVTRREDGVLVTCDRLSEASNNKEHIRL